jgi:hypothetical protein
MSVYDACREQIPTGAERAGQCRPPQAAMSRTVVLQSFRAHDVPLWVIACQRSVKRYADENGWDYTLMGDEFFDFAPSWARETLRNHDRSTLSDICRLEWIAERLSLYDSVVWVDIDVLIFDRSCIVLDKSQSFGFSYELYFDETGPHDGINNAFMFFRRGSSMLSIYLEKSYETLRAKQLDGVLGRTAIGPQLLRSLNVADDNIIKGLTILNIQMMVDIVNDPERRIPAVVTDRLKGPIGGVNLCLNQRSGYQGAERASYDQIVDAVCRALLSPR